MKILMIFLLMLGGICQAQVSLEDTEIIKSINTHIQSIDLKVKVMQEINTNNRTRLFLLFIFSRLRRSWAELR